MNGEAAVGSGLYGLPERPQTGYQSGQSGSVAGGFLVSHLFPGSVPAMDSFELNKILGAVLGTCLVLLTLNITAGAIFAPHAPEKPGYEITVPETAPGSAPGTPAAPETPIEQLLAKADTKRGEAAVKVCQTCHTFEKGGPNRVGPNLYGTVGGPKAHLPNFNYSAALKGAGGQWTFQDLNAFLRNPRATLPGTTMGYAGVNRETQRADIIAYMNSMSDKPVPLPQAAEAAPAEGAPAEAPKPQ
jgi:cytochrome c